MESAQSKMKVLIQEDVEPVIVPAHELEKETESEFAEISVNEGKTTISVDFLDIEAVQIDEIHDTHGRLSDIVESLESLLNLSVIPLRMANIAPEVVDLQRHEIFEFGGERYAFSKKMRKDKLDEYSTEIYQNLSTGLPFSLELVTSVSYQGTIYPTLLLSRAEWTFIMSKYRIYKEELNTDNKSSITLDIFAERA